VHRHIFSLALLVGLASGCAASVQPGFFFGHDLRQSKSIVFVLDLSGSMRQRSGGVVENVGVDVAAKTGGSFVSGLMGRRAGHAAENRVKKLQQKVEKVKVHLVASLNGLPPGSYFNVILFSRGVQRLAPGLVEATPASIGLVSAFVSQLEAAGSTSMKAALAAGLSAGAQQVVLLTDGLPTDASPGEILSMAVQMNQARTMTVWTVGVGSDQDFSFLRDLALANGGAFLSYD
jgi:hypothetical protein